MNAKDAILTRMKEDGAGEKVYFCGDFLDLGLSHTTAEMHLDNMACSLGSPILRAALSYYYLPRISRLLKGPAPPRQRVILDVVEREFGIKVMQAGCAAANNLRLTTAVPARPVYNSTYMTRLDIKCRGNLTLQIIPLSDVCMSWADSKALIVVQALEWLGEGVCQNPDVIQRLTSLPPHIISPLIADEACLIPWMAAVVAQLPRTN